MTIFQNIAFGLKGMMPKEEIPERVAYVMRLVKMEGYEKRKPGQLSGGTNNNELHWQGHWQRIQS